MRFLDLLQALPAILVAAVAPGFALATLLAPRWRAWERLAAAPGLSAGFLGVLGLALRLVNVPFEAATVVPAIALVAGAALLRRRRAPAPAEGTRLPRWAVMPALVAGAAAAAAFVWALHGQVLPPDWDSATHGGIANSIARSHDVLPLIPIPLEGTSFARARPGFEAMAATVSWLGGPSPAASMAPIITVVLLLLPLGLTLLALEATGSLALAVVVPMLSLGMAFPADQAILGRFPQVVDSTLVVPLVVAALRLLRGRDPLDNALLVAAATAAIWVVHGAEVLTALVIGGGLLLVAAVAAVRATPVAGLVRVATAAAAVAVGAMVVTLLTRLPSVPPPLRTEPSAASVAQGIGGLHPHALLQLLAQTDLASPLALALYAGGLLAIVLAMRRLWWVLAAHLVLLLALADSVDTHHLGGLWRQVFPWAEQDRLLGAQYWVIPFILGAAVVTLAGVMRRLARDPRLRLWVPAGVAALTVLALLGHAPLDRLWVRVFGQSAVTYYPFGVFNAVTHLTPWLPVLLVAGAALAAGWLAYSRELPFPWAHRFGPAARGLGGGGAALAAAVLVVLAVGARADYDIYTGIVARRALVTEADLAVLDGMTASLPPGALVMTDGNDDAGMWMAALTDLTPVVPNGSEGGPLSAPLVVAVANACSDPVDAVNALRGYDAVFVGSHRLPAAQHPWDVACIARLPGVQRIASEPWQGTEAAGFLVAR